MTPTEALREAAVGLAVSFTIILVLILLALLVRVPGGAEPEQHQHKGHVPLCSARQGCFA